MSNNAGDNAGDNAGVSAGVITINNAGVVIDITYVIITQ